MDKPNVQIKKMLRSPMVRRKSKVASSEAVRLERVLGLTVTSNVALASDPTTGTIAYPAGCVVVLYNSRKNKQSFIFNQAKKAITCVAFSGDGKFLVTGECGHLPAVRVWDLEEKTQVAEFLEHKFGINCVAFSPNMKYIVSVGSQHDMMVSVWSWRNNSKLASNKVATKVAGVAWSEDSNTFVTVGLRHVKFWYLDTSKSKLNQTVPLLGRAGILGDQKNNFFCDVCFGRGVTNGSVFTVTQGGLLCQFNEERLLDKWVELRTRQANCIVASQDYLYIGCADGTVRVFSCRSLQFVLSLPRPHHLGVDVASGKDSNRLVSPPYNARFPDTTAVALDTASQTLTCVYNDHSLYVWDIQDIRRVGKFRSALFHSAGIWDVETYPRLMDNQHAALPEGSFITCGSDDTIRIWNCDSHMTTDTCYSRNVYSSELLKVLYTDTDYTNLLDVEYNPAGKTDKTDTSCGEKKGVRSLRVSPDGQHLATGDRLGNIRIYDLQFADQLQMLEAHDSEILCLEYTKPKTGIQLLASASRDRLIHMFDKEQQYGFVQTLDEHSAAITSVRFASIDGELNMLSCGADKSILFHRMMKEPEVQFVYSRCLVEKTTLYDMNIDSNEKYIATACQDRNIRIYIAKNGHLKKCYSGSVGNDGVLLRVQIDPSGVYAATSVSDKSICVLDFFSGECVASVFGHSEIVTGLRFTNDLKHLISVSGDGCIFVWKLCQQFTENMQSRLSGLGLSSIQPKMLPPDPRRGTFVVTSQKQDAVDNILKISSVTSQAAILNNTCIIEESSDYRFSIGQLPVWAKKQMLHETGSSHASVSSNSPAVSARGKWAARSENEKIVVKSMLDELSNDRHHAALEAESLSQQLRSLRSETSRKTSLLVAKDELEEGDADDEDDFSAALGRRKWEISRMNEKSVDERVTPVELESEEDETCDVIYYPLDKEMSEPPASSFKVYEGDNSNVRDSDGDTGDQLSQDGTSDDGDAERDLAYMEKTKISDFLPDSNTGMADRSDKLFGEICYQGDKFRQKLDEMEEELMSLSALRGQRQSLSARYMQNLATEHGIGSMHPRKLDFMHDVSKVSEESGNMSNISRVSKADRDLSSPDMLPTRDTRTSQSKNSTVFFAPIDVSYNGSNAESPRSRKWSTQADEADKADKAKKWTFQTEATDVLSRKWNSLLSVANRLRPLNKTRLPSSPTPTKQRSTTPTPPVLLSPNSKDYSSPSSPRVEQEEFMSASLASPKPVIASVPVPMSPITGRAIRKSGPSDTGRSSDINKSNMMPPRSSSTDNMKVVQTTIKTTLPLYLQQTKSSTAKKSLPGKVIPTNSVTKSVPTEQTSYARKISLPQNAPQQQVQPQQQIQSKTVKKPTMGTKGRGVSLETKEKFKSTPNLKDVGLSFTENTDYINQLKSPKTTDDLFNSSHKIASAEVTKTPIRRSMPTTKEPREVLVGFAAIGDTRSLGVISPSSSSTGSKDSVRSDNVSHPLSKHVSVDGKLSASGSDKSALQATGRQLPKVVGNKLPIGGESSTAKSTNRLSSAVSNSKSSEIVEASNNKPKRISSSSFTLAQAKDFLLGKSSALRRKADQKIVKPSDTASSKSITGSISDSSSVGSSDDRRENSTKELSTEGEPVFIDVSASPDNSGDNTDDILLPQSLLDRRRKRPATAHILSSCVTNSDNTYISESLAAGIQSGKDEESEPADVLDDASLQDVKNSVAKQITSSSGEVLHKESHLPVDVMPDVARRTAALASQMLKDPDIIQPTFGSLRSLSGVNRPQQYSNQTTTVTVKPADSHYSEHTLSNKNNSSQSVTSAVHLPREKHDYHPPLLISDSTTMLLSHSDALKTSTDCNDSVDAIDVLTDADFIESKATGNQCAKISNLKPSHHLAQSDLVTNKSRDKFNIISFDKSVPSATEVETRPAVTTVSNSLSSYSATVSPSAVLNKTIAVSSSAVLNKTVSIAVDHLKPLLTEVVHSAEELKVLPSSIVSVTTTTASLQSRLSQPYNKSMSNRSSPDLISGISRNIPSTDASYSKNISSLGKSSSAKSEIDRSVMSLPDTSMSSLAMTSSPRSVGHNAQTVCSPLSDSNTSLKFSVSKPIIHATVMNSSSSQPTIVSHVSTTRTEILQATYSKSGQEETVENYQTNDLYSAVGNAASETEASLSSAPSVEMLNEVKNNLLQAVSEAMELYAKLDADSNLLQDLGASLEEAYNKLGKVVNSRSQMTESGYSEPPAGSDGEKLSALMDRYSQQMVERAVELLQNRLTPRK